MSFKWTRFGVAKAEEEEEASAAMNWKHQRSCNAFSLLKILVHKPQNVHSTIHRKALTMKNFRILLLIAALGVPGTESFVSTASKSKQLRPETLKYINGEDISLKDSSSLVLPLSQAKHQRRQRIITRSDDNCSSKASTSRSASKTQKDHKPSHQYINNRHSSSDWLYNFQTLPNSSVLKEIRNPVVTLTGWATLISIIYKALLAQGKVEMAANIGVPMVAHSLLMSSLGLLLVFRTNSSYQRFLEGRKIWEKILTVSRNLSRLATLYRDEIGDEKLSRTKNMIASFPYLLRHHIRSGCLCNTDSEVIDERYKLQLEEPAATYVDTRYEGDKTARQDVDKLRQCFVDRRDLPWKLLDSPKRDTLHKLARSTNRPLWICDRLAMEIKNFSLGSRERLALLKSVDELAGAVGECERIRQTAVPLNYARHALRSLTIWLFTLPFCLVKDLGLKTGPATGIIAWVLFGIYQIGYAIEDPFHKSLRLSILCDAIRRDVLGDEMGDRNSAFFIEEDGDDASLEVPEPRIVKGLNGKPGDFMFETDVTMLSPPVLAPYRAREIAAMRP